MKQTKVCSKCGVEQIVGDFKIRPKRDDKVDWCNICRGWYSEFNKHLKNKPDGMDNEEYISLIYQDSGKRDRRKLEIFIPPNVLIRIRELINKKLELNGSPNLEYSEHISSKEWKAKRKEKLALQTSCERCESTVNLQVHHITYDNFKNELMEDLEVLCKYCHNREHNKYVSGGEYELEHEKLKTGDLKIFFVKYERGNVTYMCNMVGEITKNGKEQFSFRKRKDGANDINIIYSKVVEVEDYEIILKKREPI